MYETLRLFSSELAELSVRWRELRPGGPKFQRDLRNASSRLLDQLTDDVRAAAALLNAAGGRRIQAQSLLDVLRVGLGRVFGAN